MQIELYKFSKRINSTKRPTAGSGFTTQCTIKQNAPYFGKIGGSSDTTICYPTLFLTGVDNPNAYNYCKAFGDRYYFIRDIQIDLNGAATLHCEIDVLATRRTEILGSRQYVVYGSDGNPDILDSRCISTEKARVLTASGLTTFPIPFAGDYGSGGGGYIIETVNIFKQTAFISTYYMHPASAILLAEYFTQNESAVEAANKIFNSVFDGIKAFYWTPLNLSTYGSSDTIAISNYDTGVPAFYLSERIVLTGEVAVNIPRIYTDYRKGASFSNYGIYIPFCGTSAISADEIYNDEQLRCRIGLDVRTGAIFGSIRGNTTGKLIKVIQGGAYSMLTVGQTTTPAEKAVAMAATGIAVAGRTGVAMAATAASGGILAPSVAVSAFDGIIETGKAGISQNEFTGGSSATAIGSVPGTNIETYVTAKESSYEPGADSDIIGLPVYAVKQLGSLSGYCQCKNPSIVIDDLKIIAELINQYLSGGFFIE